MFVRECTDEIRKNTAGMTGSEKAAYIAEYYWYHILLAALALLIGIIAVYHFTFGKHTVSFQCIIVNEKTDDSRDASLASALSEELGIEEREITVDSNYSVSLDGSSEGTEMAGTDYSGYDKFFFGWANGELDAVIMPESLLEYCVGLGGELRSVNTSGEVSIPLTETALAEVIEEDEEDSMVLVFPENGKHQEAAEQFLKSIQSGEFRLADAEV